MDKEVDVRYPWCGRVITALPVGRWKLGRDGEHVKLPLPFGSFKVGEKRGAVAGWKLKACRASGQLSASIMGESQVFRVETLARDHDPQYTAQIPAPKLFKRTRKLDGLWQLGGASKLGHFALDGKTRLTAQKFHEISRFGAFKIHENKPPQLIAPEPARLKLSGNWKLGGKRNPVFEFFTIPKGSLNV